MKRLLFLLLALCVIGGTLFAQTKAATITGAKTGTDGDPNYNVEWIDVQATSNITDPADWTTVQSDFFVMDPNTSTWFGISGIDSGETAGDQYFRVYIPGTYGPYGPGETDLKFKYTANGPDIQTADGILQPTYSDILVADGINPQIVSITGVSNHASGSYTSPTLAVDGDNVTIDFVTTEKISSSPAPTVTIFSTNPISATSIVQTGSPTDQKHWTATFTGISGTHEEGLIDVAAVISDLSVNTTNYDETDAIDVTYKDSPATTVYVNDDWTNQTGVDADDDTLIWLWDAFKTIQEGVDAVADAGTVEVYPATYYEHVAIDKALTLNGIETLGKAIPVIDGGGNGIVVKITADNVTLDGFTIQNSGQSDPDAEAGILAYRAGEDITGITIQNNEIINNATGIGIIRGTSNTIKSNIVHNNLYGIGIANETDTNTSTNNTIDANTVYSNAVGVYVDKNCAGNTIKNNQIYDHSENGVYLWATQTNTVDNNEITSNTNNGIHVSYGSQNVITNNEITSNGNGIHFRKRIYDGNTIANNNISGNTTMGLVYDDFVETGADEIVVAENNYWGSYTGPINATYNPQGTGDAVSDNVQFSHWWATAAMEQEASSAYGIYYAMDTNITMTDWASTADGTVTFNMNTDYPTPWNENLPHELLVDGLITISPAPPAGTIVKAFNGTISYTFDGTETAVWMSTFDGAVVRPNLYNDGDWSGEVVIENLDSKEYTLTVASIASEDFNSTTLDDYDADADILAGKTNYDFNFTNYYRNYTGEGFVLDSETVTIVDPIQYVINNITEEDHAITGLSINSADELLFDYSITYPTVTSQPALSSDWLLDAWLNLGTGTLPTGATVSITYDDNAPGGPGPIAIVTDLDVGGMTGGKWLSEILTDGGVDPSGVRTPLSSHQGLTLDWGITFKGLDSNEYTLDMYTVTAAAGNFVDPTTSGKTSETQYTLAEDQVTFLDPIQYAIDGTTVTIDDASLVNTVEGKIVFDAGVDYPLPWTTNPVLPADLLVDAKIETDSAVPIGTKFEVFYGGTSLGTYTTGADEDQWWFSEIMAGTPDRPALIDDNSDHSWTVEISNLDDTIYNVTISSIASDFLAKGPEFTIGSDVISIQDPIQDAITNTTLEITDLAVNAADELSFTATAVYPEFSDTPSLSEDWLTDAWLDLGTSTLPTGAVVDISYNGTNLVTDVAVDGETGMWLSDILTAGGVPGSEVRTKLIGHNNLTIVWGVTFQGLDSSEYTLDMYAVTAADGNFVDPNAKISQTQYVLAEDSVTFQDPIQYAIDYTTLSISTITPPSNKGALEFTMTSVNPTYPSNPVLPVAPQEEILNKDCLLEANTALPGGTNIQLSYNGTLLGETSLTSATSNIWLSEIITAIDPALSVRTPLVGHSGLTDEWGVVLTGLDYKDYELTFIDVASNNFVSGGKSDGYYELAQLTTSFVIPVLQTLDMTIFDGTTTEIIEANPAYTPGDPSTGTYPITLDPLNQEYQLDVTNVTSNTVIASDYYGFYLDTDNLPADKTYPDGTTYDYYNYWADRGVVEGATDWQGAMWDIINGTEPICYLKVANNDFSLIDGLHYNMDETEQAFGLEGSYYTGDYVVYGQVKGTNNLWSDLIVITLSVSADGTLPVYSTLNLQDRVQGTDNWIDLSMAGGAWDMYLNPDVEYYNINIKADSETNYNLASGYYGFTLNTSSLPDDFYDWWNTQGVNASASTGTWQEYMYGIITGEEPAFFVKVDAAQNYTLLDGFRYGFHQYEELLVIDGNYPLGQYTYEGKIMGVNGTHSEPLSLIMNFEKAEAVEIAIDVDPDSPLVNTPFDINLSTIDVNQQMVTDVNMNATMSSNYSSYVQLPVNLQIINGVGIADNGGISNQALTDLVITAADLLNPGNNLTGSLELEILPDAAPAPPTSYSNPGEGVPELTDPEDNGGWIQIDYTISVDDPFYVETSGKNYGVSYYVLERDADPSEEGVDWQFIADIGCYDDDSGTNQRTAMVNVPASDTAYDYRMASVYNPNKAEFGENHISYKEIENKAGSQSSWVNLGSVAAADDLPAYANIKVYLEGPYAGSGIMRNDLVLEDAPENAVDVVTVEIRSSETGETLQTADVYVSTEGYIINADGERSVPFYYTTDKEYYLVIRHRNHLDIMSSSKHMFSDYPDVRTTIDLTTAGSTYGDGFVELESNLYGMYQGEVNSDETVSYSDAFEVISNVANPTNWNADVNLDNVITYFDAFKSLTNNGESSAVPSNSKSNMSIGDGVYASGNIRADEEATLEIKNVSIMNGEYSFDVYITRNTENWTTLDAYVFPVTPPLEFNTQLTFDFNGEALDNVVVDYSHPIIDSYVINETINNFSIIIYANGSETMPLGSEVKLITLSSTIMDPTQNSELFWKETATNISTNAGPYFPGTGSGTIELLGSDDSTLPIVLSSFTANYVETDGIASLAWTTQSESNNSGWNVYRGDYRDAFIEGNAIQLNSTLIPGAGTTSQPTDYTFADPYSQELQGGQEYWYILESVDNSGESYVHGSVALTIPITEAETPLPDATVLKGNYPNPFNPSTTIQFEVKKNETGTLSIYNIEGQLVETKKFGPGAHSYEWNSEDNASGVYFYRLKTDSYKQIRKMLLLK